MMALANQEALHRCHEYVGTEHILLGLVIEGAGVGANVLKNLGVDLGKVRREVDSLLRSGPEMAIAGKLPLTPRARKVIEFAIEEARGLGHTYVGTEHLLLGLLRQMDGVAAQFLAGFALTVEKAREQTRMLLSAHVETTPRMRASAKTETAPVSGGSETLTGAAIRVIVVASTSAQKLGDPWLKAEHVLFGITEEGSSSAAKLLARHGIDAPMVWAELERAAFSASGAPQQTRRQVPLNLHDTLAYATEAAAHFHHAKAGPEELLLALLACRDGTVAPILKSLGADPNEIGAGLVRQLEAGEA
jgi:ATP-dependent Clp protease ATP-binding subunit ClpA